MSEADPARDALRTVLDEAIDALGRRDRPVVEFASPAQLEAHFAKALDGGLALGGDAVSPEQLAAAARLALRFAVHTDHPGFLNQNFAGADPVAVLGDALSAALNTTSATYEAAPVFTLMERELLRFLADKVGWGRTNAEANFPAGLMFAGGSAANMAAMQLARVRADPELVRRGAGQGPRLVALTSQRAHYSIDKAARLLGIGADNVVRVACDQAGQMRPDALARALVEIRATGGRPFFLNLTAGTTVQGAFDPIADALDLTRDEDLWVHIDGAVGGGVLFSEHERERLHGCEDADSMTWNLHKLSGATQQCSALLVQEPEYLAAAFSTRADYLFQADKRHADLDLGDLSFACARRNDALKAWLMLRARGEAWFGERIDRAVALAQRLEAWIESHPEFTMVCPRTFSHVCFWWLPPEMRGRPLNEADHATLHALAPRIKAAMQQSGRALVGYQPVNDGPNAWRMLFINPALTWADVESTMSLIADLGREQAKT